jgi:hypothetical protein
MVQFWHPTLQIIARIFLRSTPDDSPRNRTLLATETGLRVIVSVAVIALDRPPFWPESNGRVGSVFFSGDSIASWITALVPDDFRQNPSSGVDEPVADLKCGIFLN